MPIKTPFSDETGQRQVNLDTEDLGNGLHRLVTSGAADAAGATSEGNYETVAASQNAQPLGAAGAVGDFLEGLLIVVTIAASAQVQIKDGADAAITVFPNNPGGGVGTYPIPLGLISRTGAWQVTTGAGSTVVAIGTFT